ncbi:alkaline shock response membrane anchor protein AmaP [Streptococcus moroccensis]|uniref:Glucan phosphoethanolaminetransferase (Alkaline phosphatase superfamily) n=1 Tax=Streptococcus moroccensis TaxID=1451356 RepID=A0ABT9YP22_9STRE|nr:alkaline shock response membrane anchor protein AmaP [Streptococcus moroccensis]MDQ0221729.1 glucan phosphoethanolaminetransferase (alkaline phosphatase superfamily) [Streptococcus moroccensis]
MSRTKKFIMWVLGLWVLGLLFYNILAYQYVVPMVSGMRWLGVVANTVNIARPAITPFSGQFIFWSSIILAAILLMALLILSFFPRPKTQVKLKDEKGRLLLTKSAIDGLVKATISNQVFMKNPSVSSKLYKNKIVVSVKGGIIPRQGAAEKAKAIEELLVQNLREFVGLDYPLKFKVTVTDTEIETSQEQNAPRVI